MKIRSIATLATGMALALGLVACGSSDSTDTETSSSVYKQTDGSKEQSSRPAAGELTPAGTQLHFGQEATVAWVPFSESDFTKPVEGIPLNVTVEEIEVGAASDLEGVELEPGQEDSTPYFVHARIEATSGTEPPADEEPYIALDGIDDRGQDQESVVFFGEFERCDKGEMPRPFTSGESYETCLTYLMPGGGSIEAVEWGDGPSEPHEVTPYFEEPIVWSK